MCYVVKWAGGQVGMWPGVMWAGLKWSSGQVVKWAGSQVLCGQVSRCQVLCVK